MTIVLARAFDSFAILAADSRETSNAPGPESVPVPPGPVTRETFWARPPVNKITTHPTLALAVARAGDVRGYDFAAKVRSVSTIESAIPELIEAFGGIAGTIHLVVATWTAGGGRLVQVSVGRHATAEPVSGLRSVMLPDERLTDFYAVMPPPEPTAELTVRALQGAVLDGIRFAEQVGVRATSWPPIHGAIVDASGARMVPALEGPP